MVVILSFKIYFSFAKDSYFTFHSPWQARPISVSRQTSVSVEGKKKTLQFTLLTKLNIIGKENNLQGPSISERLLHEYEIYFHTPKC